MNQIHLVECHSTQELVKEKLSHENQTEQILISTESQTKGKGRHGNVWDWYKESLAFSFTAQAHEVFTLSSLEVATLLVSFFNEHFGQELQLKWPNDLMSQEKKVGGILINLHQDKTLIIGIGININSQVEDNSYKSKAASLKLDQLPENHQEVLPRLFVEYFNQHRLNKDIIVEKWNHYCFHLGRNVIIKDSHDEIEGIFKGIASTGEALILKDGVEHKIMNGSLFYN